MAEDQEILWSSPIDANGEQIRITLNVFKGSLSIQVRKWYTDPQTAEMKPGRNGISIKPKEWNGLLAALEDADTVLERRGLLK